MTNEGMDLLRKVADLLNDADLSLAILESDHIPAHEQTRSAEIYAIRQEIIELSGQVQATLEVGV